MASHLDDAILFVSRYVGAPITSCEGASWRLEGDTIYIGEGYYSSLGVPENLYPSFLLLDVWTGYVLAQKPSRLTRRRALERRHPELQELLVTIDRLEAIGDIQQIFPAFRSSLQNILKVSLPKNFDEQTPSRTFLLNLLMRASGVKNVLPAAIDRYGETVFEGLLLQKDTQADPSRLERLLTLIMPPYLKILKEQRGLSDAVATGDAADEDSEIIDFGSTVTDGGQEAEREAESSPEKDLDDRASLERDEAEGTDLFESSGVADVTALLETPLKTSDPQTLEALQELAETKLDIERGEVRENIQDLAASLNFETRARALRREMHKLTQVWHENLMKGDTTKSSFSRLPLPDGEILDETRLSQTVAESLAGVAKPAAFLQRQRSVRREFTITDTDYVFIVDRSSSMKSRALIVADTLLVIIESLAIFMRDLDFSLFESQPFEKPEIRSSVILFDTGAEVVKPLSKFIADSARIGIYSKILDTGGSTNDAAALNLAAKEFGLNGKKHGQPGTKKRERVVVLISDGNSSDAQAAESATNALRSLGVKIWAIGIGDDTMAERYNPFFVRVQQASEIADALQMIIKRKASK